MQQSWFLKKQSISLRYKYGSSWKLFYLNLGVPRPRCTITLFKLVKTDKNTGHKRTIGIIASLFLISPLTKMCKLVLHFSTEEDNYYCHCHIRFSVLITNELNLASDQRSFSYPVNANSWYNACCIDWCREAGMDPYCMKFRICLTRKTLAPSYTTRCNRAGMSPDGGGKNSEDRIPWTLTDNISANPQTQLIEFAIPLFDLFTLKVQQVGFRFAKAARF